MMDGANNRSSNILTFREMLLPRTKALWSLAMLSPAFDYLYFQSYFSASFAFKVTI